MRVASIAWSARSSESPESSVRIVYGRQTRRLYLEGDFNRAERRHTKAEIVAWIELRQPVTRWRLLGTFEDMDYEQLQCWLSELQLKPKLFEVSAETYCTTIEERK
jgi:hypothetical protein